jgi:hypothetical protein
LRCDWADGCVRLYSDRQQCNAGHPKTFTMHDVPDEVSTSRYPTLISCEGQCPLTTNMGWEGTFGAYDRSMARSE